VKGVIEVGYNVYNAGLLKFEWHNTQEEEEDDDDTNTTYNAGLWNFNWHNEEVKDTDDTTLIDNTNTDDTKEPTDTPETEPPHDVNGYNTDIIHTVKSNILDSFAASPLTSINGNNNKVLEIPKNSPKYNKDSEDVLIISSMSYPWFNSSKCGVVKMDLDNSLHTFKPFNNTKLDTVKAYVGDKLDVFNSTPNVALCDKIDTIDEYLYKKCADEIKNKNYRHNNVEIKIIPDHFKDIMSCNQKSAFTNNSSEYTNQKNKQTINFIKSCT
jgi:hypothetical protein